MRIKRIINRHLTFSRSERLVIIYFMVFAIAIFISQNFIAELLTKKSYQKLLIEHQNLVEKIEQSQDSIAAANSYKNAEENNLSAATLFYFDPNNINYEDWIQLGLTPAVAKTIVNYLASGARFYSKTDLLKIYGITQQQYENLEPYIVFENEKTVTEDKIIENDKPLALFNPNTITEQEWIELGVPDYIARRIINYLDKGGKFKQAADLQKIYGFRESDFERLQPYVHIEIESTPDSQINKNGISQISTRDINSLTKADLQLLQFSAQLAGNIINYRNKLGGFYSTSQLLEVWDINKEQVNEIFTDFYADTTLVKRIRINTASQDELKNHPYISDELAEAIILYRNKTGKMYSIYEIQKAAYISKKNFEKLAHYLEL